MPAQWPRRREDAISVSLAITSSFCTLSPWTFVSPVTPEHVGEPRAAHAAVISLAASAI